MIGLLQRVTSAHVEISETVVASINRGILVFVGVERDDDETRAERLIERLLGYRVFPDSEGKMNRSVRDVGGGILLVPQFTLAADTHKGARASFTSAAPPAVSARLFSYMVEQARYVYPEVVVGVFGADMRVTLTNDGPVTFWINT